MAEKINSLKMMKFTEVTEGYYGEENVELIRAAESDMGDFITLVKLKDQEQYQLAVNLINGTEAFDTFADLVAANELFDRILMMGEQVH